MSASAAQSVGAYFEPVFDDASFGYRRGRSPKDALRKVWKEIQSGSEWIVDADLRDFFGSADHEKLLTLVAQRVADSRVLRLIKAMLKAGSYGKGQLFPIIPYEGYDYLDGINPICNGRNSLVSAYSARRETNWKSTPTTE